MSIEEYKEEDLNPPPLLVRQVANEATIVNPKSTWKSCCFSANVAAVKYFTTLTISIIVLLFACFMIIHEQNDRALWVSMISGIAGQYMPSPIFPSSH